MVDYLSYDSLSSNDCLLLPSSCICYYKISNRPIYCPISEILSLWGLTVERWVFDRFILCFSCNYGWSKIINISKWQVVYPSPSSISEYTNTGLYLFYSTESYVIESWNSITSLTMHLRSIRWVNLFLGKISLTLSFIVLTVKHLQREQQSHRQTRLLLSSKNKVTHISFRHSCHSWLLCIRIGTQSIRKFCSGQQCLAVCW